MRKLRLLIVDDHIVVRKGIQMFLSTEPTIEVVGEAVNVPDTLRQVQRLQPDIILMDLVMPQGDGIAAIRSIKRDYPRVKVIVLTTFEDEFRITTAIEAGADGYLLKDADGDVLLKAIQAVQRGEMPLHPRITRYLLKETIHPVDLGLTESLTRREKEVLQLMAKGLSNQDLAQTLKLSKGTVKVHVSNILGKLNVSNRIEAAMLAMQLGLAPLDKPNSVDHLAY